MKEWACDPLPLVQTLQTAVRGLLAQGTGIKSLPLQSDALYEQQNAVVKLLVRIARNGGAASLTPDQKLALLTAELQDMTVTDTENGKTRVYFNPMGTPASPVQDTSAFATCP